MSIDNRSLLQISCISCNSSIPEPSGQRKGALGAIRSVCMVACRGEGTAAAKGCAALCRPLTLGSPLRSSRWWHYILAVLFGIILAEGTGIHLVVVGLIDGVINGGPHDDSGPVAAAGASDAGREPDLAREDDEL